MKLIALIFIVALFASCDFVLPEDEPAIIYSKLDGEQYKADMESDFNSRKFTYLIEDEKFDQVPYAGIMDIADSLTTQDSSWRSRYFDAINAYDKYHYYSISKKDYPKLSVIIFHYFMTHPKEYISKFEIMSFESIEFWDARLKEEIAFQIENDLTYDKLIDVAVSNCKNCNDEDHEVIKHIVKGER